MSTGGFLSVQVNQWPGSRAQLQLSCRTVTLWGVHVMCRRQWQTCGFCVSVWAGLHWAIGHMFGLCVHPLNRCFLGVTCAFLFRGGEPCGWLDAYSRPDYIFCVQLSVQANATLETQEREGKSESARFSLLMENIPRITPKMSLLFVSSLLPFALGFFFF